MARLFYFILFAFSIFFLPWWFYFIFGLVGILVFENFYELGLIGFVYDLAFGLPGYGLIPETQFTFCLVSLMVVLVAEEVKKRTVFYCDKRGYTNFYTTLGK